MALLVYTAVTNRVHLRDDLATMFWAESGRSARASLRRAVWSLSSKAGPELFQADRQTLGIHPKADLWIDVAEFWRLTGNNEGIKTSDLALNPSEIKQLHEAVALYQADFLQGFTLPDSPLFDDWQFLHRERLHTRLSQVLVQLIDWHRSHGEYEVALDLARRRVDMDRLFEPGHRVVMQLLALMGRKQDAREQFEICRTALDEAFAVAPERETAELMERITGGEFAPAPAAVATSAPDQPAPQRQRNYPQSASPLIGRTQELHTILRYFQVDHRRLVTIVGPGGIGKTRLATEVAVRSSGEAGGSGKPGAERRPEVEDATATEQDQWTDVCFVRLAGVSQAENLPQALADALEVPLSSTARTVERAMQQLGEQVRNRRLLLILDNFEQLQSAAGLIGILLRATEELQILATSRTRLRLSDEQVVVLQGLPYPKDENAAIAGRFPAIQLFVQRAQQARPEFMLTQQNSAAIVRICRHMDGLPLGIELAAAWTSTLSVHEIESEMCESLDFLTTTDVDLPLRHSSMRRLLDGTWNRLSPEQQRIFSGLAVFHGSFTRAAAQALTDLSLADLRRFVEESLLTMASDGRYAIHEVLRQYAHERLASEPARLDEILRRHLHYYSALLTRCQADLVGREMPRAIAELTLELDNLRTAWRVAVAQQEWLTLESMEIGLYHFCDTCGMFQEAESFFRYGQEQLSTSTASISRECTADRQQQRAYALLLGARGWFMLRRGIGADSHTLLTESISRLRAVTDAPDSRLGLALVWLGTDCFVREDYRTAEDLLRESLSIFTAANDHLDLGHACARLATALELQGRYDEAWDILNQGIDALIAIDSRRALGLSLSYKGMFAVQQGRYTDAADALAESYQLSLEVEDQEGVVAALETTGQLRTAQGRYRDAKECLRQAMVIYEEMGAHAYIKRPLYLLAMVQRLEGDYGAAENNLRRYLRIARDSGTPMSEMLAYLEMGKLAHARGDYVEAEAYLRRSLPYAAGMTRKRDHADALHSLGRAIEQDAPRGDEAKELLCHALLLARAEATAPLTLEILLSLTVLDMRGAAPATLPAAAVLGLIVRHPATTFDVRRRARLRLETGNLKTSERQPHGGSPGDPLDDLSAMVDQALSNCGDKPNGGAE